MLRLGIAVAALAAATSQAVAAPPAAGNRAAYDAALKCYVANVLAEGQRRDAGDIAKAQIYQANSKRAFDGATALGREIGLSNRQMNGDLDAISARELSRMTFDRAYFVAAVGQCRGIGLM